ncbi:nuclear transport factor 2 family protein [Arthrobacter sp. Marseille-P9274]|uniref:nuclear transport factor 2 family protein n=1 Tax=Arthrobacter sp. Marseille-P9274 TaxID=2866572 RepID=UPI0021C8A010|nr:nuclear transport factor 2 family protein [Arthrobacter sp. Marseille-P9274]
MKVVSDSNVELINSLYQSYNAKDLDGWLSHFAEDAYWYNVPTGETHKGLPGQRANYEAWSIPFPQGVCQELSIRGGNDVMVAEFNGVGVHEGPLITPEGKIAPTFRSTSLAFCDIHTIRSNRITETHRYWDLAGAAAQLGL